MKIQPETS